MLYQSIVRQLLLGLLYDIVSTWQLYEFDQREFLYKTSPAMISMDDIGYMYVPSGCKSGANST